jgi:hypothetical protein
MEESSIKKVFILFFLTPLGGRVNILINLFLQVLFKVSAVGYSFHYLPLVSTTPAVLVAKFATDVIDTDGKFATCVIDTGGAP